MLILDKHMGDWIVVGKGFGFQFEINYLRWIYWAPGTQTQEGLLLWGKETEGIVPWRENSPKHMHRTDNEILGDLLATDIVGILQQKVKARIDNGHPK